MRRLLLALAAFVTAAGGAAAEPVLLHAAGSLKAAMTGIAEGFEQAHGATVTRIFGPSGLLRGRIEEGEAAEVYASAALRHAVALNEAGRAAPPVLFARNRLCALAQPDVETSTPALLDTLLDPAIRVGTSTPGADPAGDYAFEVFERAGALRDGATGTLKAKALRLTGGPDSAQPPDGRNPYAWVMTEDRADVFLTYCTNAVLARQDTPSLVMLALAEDLAVGAEYGLTVMNGAGEDAWALAMYILSPAGQRVLAEYGFAVAGVPAE